MKIRKFLTHLCLAMGLFMTAGLSQSALLGLTQNEPILNFSSFGIISYKATTGLVTISGVPATLFQTDPFLFGDVLGTGVDDEKVITVQFRVDTLGNFVSGINGPDLVVKGSIDVNFDGIVDYDGILLEAEVTQFGFENGAAGGNDSFDLRLNSVTGALAPLYNRRDLVLSVLSEVSTEFLNPFAGSFAANFVGQAKGAVGATEPVQPPGPIACQLDLSASCSVDGGPNKSKCRIKTTKSPKHWEHVDFDCHGRNCRKSKYGMHGSTVPPWANRYSTTDVTFTYLVTNTGTTPVSNLLVNDSFDTPLSGVLPAVLAPGQSVTLTRIEKLSESIEDTVTVTGEYQTALCADSDVVVIKSKLRERRRHDEDRFKDKDKRNDD